MSSALHAQAQVQLPDTDSKAESTLSHAGIVWRTETDSKGTVNRFPARKLPPGSLFVERQALVEHLFYEAQRLQPDRSD